VEKYRKAPITEALFDIRVDPVLGVSASDVERLHAKISGGYPDKKPRRMWEAKLEFKEGTAVQTASEDKGVDGFLFWSADKKQVVQFRLDGFTFSRLKPYGSWEESFPEAMRLWKIYRDELKPVNIKRVASRFINSIEIPQSKFELKDYFVDPPQPPKGLPQELDGFLSRLIVRFEENVRAVTTFTNQPSSKPDAAAVLFDIDVFADVKFPANYDQLPSIFDKLHKIKNDIFERSLTDKTKELFK
jgi:uncharacterized protein (TIGR04255 family)